MVRNISWLGAGNVLVKPLWFFFITAVCVRFLGIGDYGVMNATLALAGIVGSLINLGILPYSIREIARDRDKSSLFFSNFFPFRALTGLLGVGVALAVGFVLGYRSQGILALLFAGCYSLLQQLSEYCRAYYRAFEVFRYEAISIMLEKIAVISFGTILLLVHSSATWVLAGMALGVLLTLAANIYWLTGRLAAFRTRLIDASFIKTNLPQALPLGLVTIFSMVYFRTDSIMLEAIQGEVVAGQYGLGFRFLEALILLPAIIVATLLPRLSSLFVEVEMEAIKKLMTRSLGGLAFTSSVLALILTYAAPFLVKLIEPRPTSDPAVLALQILVWVFPFSSASYVLSTALTAMDDQKVLAWMLGIAALLNLVLNGILIPVWSLYGACYATLFTQASIAVAMAVRYQILITTRPNVARP